MMSDSTLLNTTTIVRRMHRILPPFPRPPHALPTPTQSPTPSHAMVILELLHRLCSILGILHIWKVVITTPFVLNYL